MKRWRIGVSVCSVIVALSLASIVSAGDGSTLTGRVTDRNNALVVGAKVEALNIDTNVPLSAETNDDGIFVITNVPPGRYRIFVRKAGFRSIVKPDVVLHVEDVVGINFSMEVGSIDQSITIEGGAPLLQTQSASVGTLVDRQFVGDLPLNGRSFQSLITLTPGVVLTAEFSSPQGQFSVNGQRANANYFIVDGVSANIGSTNPGAPAQTAAGSLPGLTVLGGTNNLVSIDALQEFRIQTSSFAAEFGRTPGAQISIVTRSGTNELRGSVFDYLRNDVFDANNWFANRQRLRKPALRQNDFGGVIGGPILVPRLYDGRDRTFFFFSYEGLRLRQPQIAIASVPSIQERQNAAPGIQPLLRAFPIPNGADLLDPITGKPNGTASYSAGYSNSSTLNAVSIRIDHTLNSRLAVFGRYNHAPSDAASRAPTSPVQVSTTSVGTETTTIGGTISVTASMSDEFRANYSTTEGKVVDSSDNLGGAVPVPTSLLFPPFTTPDQALVIARFTVGDFSLFLGKVISNTQRQVNIIDNLSLVTGAHELKGGIDFRRLTPIYAPRAYGQTIQFRNQNAVLNGAASVLSVQTVLGGRPLFTNLSAYAQDTWRATPKLTLTYGLRWELNPAPSEARGNDPFAVTGFDNPATLALAPRGTPLWKTTYDNFAPRLGAAYRLFDRTGLETILRGGFGVFYDMGNGMVGDAFSGFPFIVGRNQLNVPFPIPPGQATPPAISFNPPYPSLDVFDPRLKLPYTLQWNIAAEQSLGLNQALTITYVAAVGRRLLLTRNLRSPNASFSFANLVSNGATSDYHALQVQYRRRLSRGLQVLGSYTWSHAIDEASDDGGGGSGEQVRGNASFDIRHNFTAAVTYSLPSPQAREFRSILRNWSVDGIIRAQSAPPFSIVTGAFLFPDGRLIAVRPNLVLGVPIYIHDPAVPGGRRINPAAFHPAPNGQQGDLGRNTVRGFPLYQVDLALRRKVNLTERLSVEFRPEAFNLFNHPNFANPINDLSNGRFGQSTMTLSQSLGGLSPIYQVGGPRSLQFSLRFQY